MEDKANKSTIQAKAQAISLEQAHRTHPKLALDMIVEAQNHKMPLLFLKQILPSTLLTQMLATNWMNHKKSQISWSKLVNHAGETLYNPSKVGYSHYPHPLVPHPNIETYSPAVLDF